MFFSKSEFEERVKKLQTSLEEQKLDAIIIGAGCNVRYLSGADTGRILISQDHAIHWARELYTPLLEESPLERREPESKCVREFVTSNKFKAVGIDEILLSGYQSLDPLYQRVLKPSDAVEQLRKIKSEREIEVLKKSAQIARKGMDYAESKEIKGMTEQQLTAEIEYEIRRNGSEATPFGGGLLCLSGPNAGYPHKPPTDRKIRDGDTVVIDLGAVFEGYHSDMTRTFRIGKLDPKEDELCDFIDWLKLEAIDRIDLGESIAEMHKFVESEIEKKGYVFHHLTGHGVGLEIHELPGVSPDEKDVFTEGMVLTIEPGIYYNGFGTRSEDTIVVGKKIEVITA
jgi:Xaa-Pro aminopeptidase